MLTTNLTNTVSTETAGGTLESFRFGMRDSATNKIVYTTSTTSPVLGIISFMPAIPTVIPAPRSGAYPTLPAAQVVDGELIDLILLGDGAFWVQSSEAVSDAEIRAGLFVSPTAAGKAVKVVGAAAAGVTYFRVLEALGGAVDNLIRINTTPFHRAA